MTVQVDPIDSAPPSSPEPGDVTVEAATGTQEDDVPMDEALLPDDEHEEELCPNMDAFIPGERLPDFLDVYDNSTLIESSGYNPSAWEGFTQHRYPVKFVRVYPPRAPADKGDASVKPPSGWLNLPSSEPLGTGSHSDVILAPFVLPSTATAPSVVGRVAVKFASTDRHMLWNEAMIYNAFPRKLEEDSPDGPPVVPKFYGFYIPSVAFDYPKLSAEDRNSVRKRIKKISPILLLEPCGEQINPSALGRTNLRKIGRLLDRLHDADFIQGSFYERNILVQPGPLTLPRAKRSLDEPSFRIIDFGRGMWLGVNCSPKDFDRAMPLERGQYRDLWF